MDALVETARAVLEHNWLGGATRPGPRLYPHQWSWDSAFNAIGWSHVDWDRAATELRTLFAAQWPNGMLPHIVFSDGASEYFPGPDVWDTPQFDGQPRTSGIVQPPVHALAVRLVAERAPSPEQGRALLGDLFEPLRAWHDYLYRERDHDGTGLVAIRHPWESGMDDSPVWDPALVAIPLDPATTPTYRRVDLTLVEADQRPDAADYDYYVALVEAFKRAHYDEARMRETCPFWVVDPLFNSALACGGEELATIAEAVGADPDPFRSAAAHTTRALNDRLWDPELGLYVSYDRRRRMPLRAPIVACFAPLLTAAPNERQMHALTTTMTSMRFWPPHERGVGVTSYDRLAPGFSRRQYWRGPVWANVNWLLARGMRRHGLAAPAERLDGETLELVERSGYWEYYDPLNGEGLGSERFSWTAALVLDILATKRNL